MSYMSYMNYWDPCGSTVERVAQRNSLNAKNWVQFRIKYESKRSLQNVCQDTYILWLGVRFETHLSKNKQAQDVDSQEGSESLHYVPQGIR